MKNNRNKKIFYNSLKHYISIIVRAYCGISRPQLYKIFNGAEPKKWVNAYTFESIRVPTHLINECV